MNPNEIRSGNGWVAEYDETRGGGPLRLVVAGRTLLGGFHCSVDGEKDTDCTPERFRLFHKGGQAVSEITASFAGGHRLRTICRCAGDCLRVTWDFNWVRGIPLKESVVLGGGLLPGAWRSLKVLRQDGSWGEESLAIGMEKAFEAVPLALVFEDAEGGAFQLSPGFDLWRWNNGMAMTTPVEEGGEPVEPMNCPASARLSVTSDGVEFAFVVARPLGGATVPQGGDYRFTMCVAWCGAETAAETPEATALSFAEYPLGLAAFPPDAGQSVELDFRKLPVCGSGLRSGSALPCWESNKTMKAAKKCIRQLGAWRSEGTLVLKGLLPAVCGDGNHCEKRRPVLHWDLLSILSFVAWTKNVLGEGWRLCCPADGGPCAGLPALRSLALPNGFAYGEILEQENEDTL